MGLRVRTTGPWRTALLSHAVPCCTSDGRSEANGGAPGWVKALLVVVVAQSLALACQRTADAARIVVQPLPWASHTFGLAKLSAELNRRGHQVSSC